MKKTLLLSALVVTATAFAGTTGSFSVDTKHSSAVSRRIENPTAAPADQTASLTELVSKTSHEVKLATEVKLGESGVTLGGDAVISRKWKKNSNPVNFEVANGLPEKAKAFVKYDFTTGVEGLEAYIKGTVDTGLDVKGEGQVSYKKDDITYSLNSNTVSNIVNPDFKSEHEVKVEGKIDKLEDLLLSAKVSHKYEKDTPVVIKTDAKGAIKLVEGVKIGIHNKFDALAVANEKVEEVDEFVIEGKFNFDTAGSLAEMFKLYASYDKDSTSATGALVIEYLKDVQHGDPSVAIPHGLNYGVKLDAKYTGVKNLELAANGLFAGKAVLADPITDSLNEGLINLGLSAKYDAKVNDKLTLTPKAGIDLGITGINPDAASVGLTLGLVPELGVEFKPTNDVTLTSSVKSTVKFGERSNAFNYTDTGLEAKLGLKYTW